MRINRQVCGLAATAALAMMATGCGDEGGEEAVFLYFINGYTGSAAMSINSNRGNLVTNVPFGERYGDGESCGPDKKNCLPVRIDRQLGSDWTVLLENMVQPADLKKDLFSMYPHETGTVVLTRRNGEASVDSTLLRHTQSISSDCTVTFVNGLSTDNTYLGIANYSMAPEFFLDDIAIGGFGDEENTPFISECGPLPIDETHQNLMRKTVIDAVKENPWFFFDCSNGDRACEFGWGLPVHDGRSRLEVGGTYLSVLNSREYFECIQGAISLRQPDDMGMSMFPPPEPDCPRTPITWADFDVDFQAVQQCQEAIVRNVETEQPGQSDTLVSYQGSLLCDARFRIRNEGQDILFGPKGNDALGSHGDGALVESKVKVPDGSQRFYVLLGRPVNPIVWQWDSSETFVDLKFYPYFNDGGDRPTVGDYND